MSATTESGGIFTRHPVFSIAVGAAAATAVVLSISLATQGGASPPTAPAGSGGPVASPSSAGSASSCDEPTVTVSSAKQLKAALSAAAPGDVITLEPGTYRGHFEANVAGSPARPISLCGTEDSVLDGGDIEHGYVLHLDGASYWHLVGFGVVNGQKGIIGDAVDGTVLEALTVSHIGDEAIHLRAHSSDNRIVGNTISDTGVRKPKFGEGIYIGSAESNWCDISDCEPDRSDNNVIEDNDIFNTSAESIDLKEGTTGGIVRNNTFNGAAMVEADSWVDVKGNNWLIEANIGTDSPMDGFQTHQILDGWGSGNVFRGNTAAVNGPGFGFSLTPALDNVVECGNKASGAGEGVSNVTCSAG